MRTIVLCVALLLPMGCSILSGEWPTNNAMLVIAFVEDGELVLRGSWEESPAKCVESKQFYERTDTKRYQHYKVACWRANVPDGS